MADLSVPADAAATRPSGRAVAVGSMIVLAGAVLHFVGTLLAFAWDEGFIGRVVDFTFDGTYIWVQVISAWLPVLLAVVGVLIVRMWSARRDIAIGMILCSGVIMLLDRELITAIVYWGSPFRIGAPVTFVGAAAVLSGGVVLASTSARRGPPPRRAA